MILSLKDVCSGYNKVIGYVIESYWSENISRFVNSNYFDHLYVTYERDCERIEEMTGVPTSCLGRNSDVLSIIESDLIEPVASRPIDVLRTGRQPVGFDDDQLTAEACRTRKLVFHGRPPFLDDHRTNPTKQHKDLMLNYLLRSKYVLAHSNLVDESLYTHPTKEYITERWTDALACGSIVAGVQPKTDPSYQGLWPEATLSFDSTDLDELDKILEALGQWTPGLARHNQMMALKKLDSRWRFKDIAGVLELECPKLDEDLAKIEGYLSEYDFDRWAATSTSQDEGS